jgi:single-strand DNA-binding protein
MSATIHVLGRIGREPELRPAGQSQVCSFPVAVDHRSRSDAGDTTKRTVWYKVETWSKSAGVAARHLRKGQRIYVHGEHDEDRWTDKDGIPRTAQVIRNARWDFADAATPDSAPRREEAPAARGQGADPGPAERQEAGRPAAASQPAAAAFGDEEPPF